jgi:4-amino-4-deoxy-L-arabinose transferase-like glycosyltransferase
MKNFIEDIISSRKKAIYTIFILSFTLRFASMFVMADLKDPQMWEFGLISNEMLNGNGYSFSYFDFEPGTVVPSAHMPPGLPVLFFLVFSAFGFKTIFSNILLLMINTLLASFSCVLIYKISEIIYDRKIALLSGLILSFFPVYIFSTLNFNSIIFYHFLLGLSFYYYLKFTYIKNDEKGRNITGKSFIIFSVAMGLFLYFRAEMFGFIFLISFILLFKKKIFKSAILILAGLIIISPWIIRNYNVFGKFIPGTTSSGINFYTGHNYASTGSNWVQGTNIIPISRTPEMDKILRNFKMDQTFEINASKAGFDESFKFIKSNPGFEIINSAKKAFYFIFIDLNHPKSFNPLYFMPWFIILTGFIYGYFISRKNNEIRSKLNFVLYYLLFMLIIVIVFFSIPRYQIQTSYIMIPTASYGLINLYYKIFKKKNQTANT